MYSPKIEEKFVPILYRIAKEKEVPMTRVVNQIIGDYLTNHLKGTQWERSNLKADDENVITHCS